MLYLLGDLHKLYDTRNQSIFFSTAQNLTLVGKTFKSEIRKLLQSVSWLKKNQKTKETLNQGL